MEDGMDRAYRVDWERRRVLHATVTNPTHCLHGSRLVEWCGACGDDLDAIAADMTPGEAA